MTSLGAPVPHRSRYNTPTRGCWLHPSATALFLLLLPASGRPPTQQLAANSRLTTLLSEEVFGRPFQLWAFSTIVWGAKETLLGSKKASNSAGRCKERAALAVSLKCPGLNLLKYNTRVLNGIHEDKLNLFKKINNNSCNL